MLKHKKGLALLLVMATILTMCVGSLAYFTDRVTSSATATAGSLELAISAIDVSQSTNLKPGEGVTIDFTLTNNGNKSADVRETLVLTSSKAMSATPEFELYHADDITWNEGIPSINDGAAPVSVRTLNATSTQITYEIPEFILNGTGTGAEIESGITSNAKESSYVLIFSGSAGAEFKNVSITLDYMAQAKQHRNTNDTTWSTVMTKSVPFADNNITVVPESSES